MKACRSNITLKVNRLQSKLWNTEILITEHGDNQINRFLDDLTFSASYLMETFVHYTPSVFLRRVKLTF